MKTTTNKWMLVSKYTGETVSPVVWTKARAKKVIENSGRTDLTMTQVNW